MMARNKDHDRISQKAHELWEAEGRPHGRDQEHWDQAREIIAIEDSQGDTLLPRNTGAEEPVEEADEALRNMADFPNLTDQGENLLTSTDREPDLLATPAGRKGRMPKAEVPTSDQPGIPPKGRKAAAKPAPSKAAAPASEPNSVESSTKPAAGGARKSKAAVAKVEAEPTPAPSEPKAKRAKKAV
jgi:hypothetical protein